MDILPKDIAVEIFGPDAFDYKDSSKDNEKLMELYKMYINPINSRKRGGSQKGSTTKTDQRGNGQDDKEENLPSWSLQNKDSDKKKGQKGKSLKEQIPDNKLA